MSFTWNRAKNWVGAGVGFSQGKAVLGWGLGERGNNCRLSQLLLRESCSFSLTSSLPPTALSIPVDLLQEPWRSPAAPRVFARVPSRCKREREIELPGRAFSYPGCFSCKVSDLEKLYLPLGWARAGEARTCDCRWWHITMVAYNGWKGLRGPDH